VKGKEGRGWKEKRRKGTVRECEEMLSSTT